MLAFGFKVSFNVNGQLSHQPSAEIIRVATANSVIDVCLNGVPKPLAANKERS